MDPTKYLSKNDSTSIIDSSDSDSENDLFEVSIMTSTGEFLDVLFNKQYKPTNIGKNNIHISFMIIF